MGQLEQLGHGGHPGDVGEVEAPAQAALDIDRPPRGGDARHDAGVEAARRRRAHLGRGVDGEAERAGLLGEAAAELVVEVGGPGRVGPLGLGAGEQAPLGGEVVLHVRVVVEVVARQVGEERGGEAGAGHPALGERVGGDLHRARRVPRVAHAGEQRLQVDASGVVWATGSTTPPTRASMVPMRPQRCPAASSTARSRNAEVVLPLVPVTPTTVSDSEGCPATAAAARAMPRRASGTTTCGIARPSSRRSTSTAAAPRAAASAAKSWPSARRPGRAQKRAPGPASEARWTTEVMRAAADQLLEGHSGRDTTTGRRRTYGKILRLCRENSAICSKAGAATSPP